MSIRANLAQYFNALEESNIHEILKLFSEKAKVHSPLYGTMPAKDFYLQLFEDTSESKLNVVHFFVDEAALKAAAHFHYQWILFNGDTVRFEGVDIFEFDNALNIQQLSILYDTAASRQITDQLKRR